MQQKRWLAEGIGRQKIAARRFRFRTKLLSIHYRL
jgi:hypothetical protein